MNTEGELTWFEWVSICGEFWFFDVSTALSLDPGLAESVAVDACRDPGVGGRWSSHLRALQSGAPNIATFPEPESLEATRTS